MVNLGFPYVKLVKREDGTDKIENVDMTDAKVIVIDIPPYNAAASDDKGRRFKKVLLRDEHGNENLVFLQED